MSNRISKTSWEGTQLPSVPNIIAVIYENRLPWDILQALQGDSSASLVPGTEAHRPRGWQGGGWGKSGGGRGGREGGGNTLGWREGREGRKDGHVAVSPGEHSGEAGQVLPWLALN